MKGREESAFCRGGGSQHSVGEGGVSILWGMEGVRILWGRDGISILWGRGGSQHSVGEGGVSKKVQKCSPKKSYRSKTFAISNKSQNRGGGSRCFYTKRRTPQRFHLVVEFLFFTCPVYFVSIKPCRNFFFHI
jgi:hypothetical protein